MSSEEKNEKKDLVASDLAVALYLQGKSPGDAVRQALHFLSYLEEQGLPRPQHIPAVVVRDRA